MNGRTLAFPGWKLPEWKNVATRPSLRRPCATEGNSAHELRLVPRTTARTQGKAESFARKYEKPVQLALVPRHGSVTPKFSETSVFARRGSPRDAYAIGMQTRHVVDQVEWEITRQAHRRSGKLSNEAREGKSTLVLLPARPVSPHVSRPSWRSRTREAVRRLFGSPLAVSR